MAATQHTLADNPAGRAHGSADDARAHRQGDPLRRGRVQGHTDEAGNPTGKGLLLTNWGCQSLIETGYYVRELHAARAMQALLGCG